MSADASALALSLERVAVPADRLRRSLYATVARVPALTPWLVRRDRRVALIACAHALVAFVLTATFPMLLFVVGPIVLGVAHVSADVRYLVLRRRLPAWWKQVVIGVCLLLVAMRGAGEILGGMLLLHAEHAVALGWMALAVIVALRLGGNRRRAVVMAFVIAALGAASLLAPFGSRLVFVHVHNLVAVTLWIWLFRMRLSYALVPLLFIFGLAALLGSPWVLRAMDATGGASALGLHLLGATDFTAPGLGMRWAVHLTLCYVFLQSVHYAAWLLLIPQEDMTRQAPLTFRGSARSLVTDFGSLGVGLIVLATLLVIAGAFSDALASRRMYLSLAMFHNYLELAMAAYFFVRGGFGARARLPQAT
ncbi:MAG TPA: hypothetical protein PKD61_04120 [Polyangiaceae bacterium]|nr:hypothetical protein [Polyangiaceae bacterium]